MIAKKLEYTKRIFFYNFLISIHYSFFLILNMRETIRNKHFAIQTLIANFIYQFIQLLSAKHCTFQDKIVFNIYYSDQ